MLYTLKKLNSKFTRTRLFLKSALVGLLLTCLIYIKITFGKVACNNSKIYLLRCGSKGSDIKNIKLIVITWFRVNYVIIFYKLRLFLTKFYKFSWLASLRYRVTLMFIFFSWLASLTLMRYFIKVIISFYYITITSEVKLTPLTKLLFCIDLIIIQVNFVKKNQVYSIIISIIKIINKGAKACKLKVLSLSNSLVTKAFKA